MSSTTDGSGWPRTGAAAPNEKPPGDGDQTGGERASLGRDGVQCSTVHPYSKPALGGYRWRRARRSQPGPYLTPLPAGLLPCRREVWS